MIEASASVCLLRLSMALNPVVATNELQFPSNCLRSDLCPTSLDGKGFSTFNWYAYI